MILIRPRAVVVGLLENTRGPRAPCRAGRWSAPGRRPQRTSASMASAASRVMSKARWQVTFIGRAASVSSVIRASSICPSAVRQPNTTPATPSSRQARTSSSIVWYSSSEYRKSPPRGRMMTWNGMVAIFSACRTTPMLRRQPAFEQAGAQVRPDRRPPPVRRRARRCLRRRFRSGDWASGNAGLRALARRNGGVGFLGSGAISKRQHQMIVACRQRAADRRPIAAAE